MSSIQDIQMPVQNAQSIQAPLQNSQASWDWSSTISYINSIFSYRDQSNIQELLNALKPIAFAAGGTYMKDFTNLMNDFQVFCQSPFNGVGAMQADLSAFGALGAPNLSTDQIKEALTMQLENLYQFVGQSGLPSSLSYFMNVFLPFESAMSSQIPLPFTQTISSTFISAIEAYQTSNPPTQAEIDAVQSQIELLMQQL